MLAQQEAGGACAITLSDAVEFVVNEVSSRLRAVPGYARVLREPVAASLRYIDEMVETIPGAVLCCRSTFSQDPRVNAFFVSPRHLQDVFSQSEEVRYLFDADPEVQECWALLCMRKEERRQLGMALVGDAVQKDVMQTAVSFTDHEVVSPGGSESAARCALKCCIFKGLLAHVRRTAAAAKTNMEDLENRLRVLRGRLRTATERADAEQRRTALLAEIEVVERALAAEDLRVATLQDHLQFVADALGNPAEYLRASASSLRLSRMAIKLEQGMNAPGYQVPLSEIHIASQTPRISVLVRFPRRELQPRQDLLRKAELFLAT